MNKKINRNILNISCLPLYKKYTFCTQLLFALLKHHETDKPNVHDQYGHYHRRLIRMLCFGHKQHMAAGPPNTRVLQIEFILGQKMNFMHFNESHQEIKIVNCLKNLIQNQNKYREKKTKIH